MTIIPGGGIITSSSAILGMVHLDLTDVSFTAATALVSMGTVSYTPKRVGSLIVAEMSVESSCYYNYGATETNYGFYPQILLYIDGVSKVIASHSGSGRTVVNGSTNMIVGQQRAFTFISTSSANTYIVYAKAAGASTYTIACKGFLDIYEVAQ